MVEDGTAKFRSDVLLQEYLRLCTEIRSIEAANERIVTLGLTLISFAAAVGLAQKVDLIFFLLPIGIIGVVGFGALSYVEIFSLGGYKRHLEDLINETISERLLLWECLVPKRERRNLLGRLMLLIYFIVGVAVCAVSVFRLNAAYGPYAMSAMSAGTVFLLSLLVAGLRRMSGMFAETYAQSKLLWKSHKPGECLDISDTSHRVQISRPNF